MTAAPSKKVERMTVFNKQHVNTKTQPMFFGAPLGVQRYDEYKYPVFDKLTTQMPVSYTHLTLPTKVRV